MSVLTAAVEKNTRDVNQLKSRIKQVEATEGWLSTLCSQIPSDVDSKIKDVLVYDHFSMGRQGIGLEVSDLADAVEIIGKMKCVEPTYFGKEHSTPVFRDKEFFEKPNTVLSGEYYPWRLSCDPFSHQSQYLNANKFEANLTLDNGVKIYMSIIVKKNLFDIDYQTMRGRGTYQSGFHSLLVFDYIQAYASGSPENLGNRVMVWENEASFFEAVERHLNK